MSDVYASHLPVLREIGRLLPIYSVLEFGMGHYSTPLFLDKEVFPSLRSLTSFETDLGWWESVRSSITDLRANLLYEQESIEDVIQRSLRLREYDLIFVDNGNSKEERIRAIEALMYRHPPNLVVIHDYEQSEYQKASMVDGLYYVMNVDKYHPSTGILSKEREAIDYLRKNAKW